MDKAEELKQRMLKLAFYRHPEDEDVIYLRLGALCKEINEYAQQVSIEFVRYLMKGKPMVVGEKTDSDIGIEDIEKVFDEWIKNKQR